MLEALEVLKIASGIGTVISEKMIIFNGLNSTFKTIKV